MNKKNSLPCEVVRDLVPLYLEKLTGEGTRELMEFHLTECADCSQYLENMKEGENSVTEQDERKQIDYLKQVRQRSRIHSVLLFFIIMGAFLLLYALYFVAGPSETDQMLQALVGAEELGYCLGGYESIDGTTGSLSPEEREQNINEYNEKVAQYYSYQSHHYHQLRETHADLINRVNLENPQDYRIDHMVIAEGFSFAVYNNVGRNSASLHTHLFTMGLSVLYNGDGEYWQICFGYWNPKCHTVLMKENGEWKVLDLGEPEPQEYDQRNDEKKLILLLGEDKVSQIHQITQNHYDTFEEARIEAQKLQKLVFSNRKSAGK